jgi:hypothetical protein
MNGMILVYWAPVPPLNAHGRTSTARLDGGSEVTNNERTDSILGGKMPAVLFHVLGGLSAKVVVAKLALWRSGPPG